MTSRQAVLSTGGAVRGVTGIPVLASARVTGYVVPGRMKSGMFLAGPGDPGAGSAPIQTTLFQTTAIDTGVPDGEA